MATERNARSRPAAGTKGAVAAPEGGGAELERLEAAGGGRAAPGPAGADVGRAAPDEGDADVAAELEGAAPETDCAASA